MGCQESKTKGGSNAPSPGLSFEFLNLANKEHHPVAQKLLEEWTMFVDAQEKRNRGNTAAAREYHRRPHEIWADTEAQPVSHRSVDYVGKMFLEYIKLDLSKRGWGGNFDYKVAGVPQQGFLKANANVDTVYSDVTDEVQWEIKIHYHSSGTS
ncbi:hypothetical protein STCU_01675 [Strigomonas culicis]|uniref:Uncharacterized protein n=1 Tax=Strigomonas culicis TaxID=28005 RepID=S9WEY6_9TRYP|nr:hypothetical protein STCU_06151 [Strigomonas culicis]EPY33352.1 hypothetical protein STCU_02276 [Strigomonas culicis]EPY34295.1 hypothetical protein STCU_01675 [Strigomonas culicis]|eukprot:EPY26645.1 hypothetical protein STCU_06151 [Strigomonas culicis]